MKPSEKQGGFDRMARLETLVSQISIPPIPVTSGILERTPGREILESKPCGSFLKVELPFILQKIISTENTISRPQPVSTLAGHPAAA